MVRDGQASARGSVPFGKLVLGTILHFIFIINAVECRERERERRREGERRREEETKGEESRREESGGVFV